MFFNYSNIVSKEISNNIFRLHIIANSNSYEDQNLKYKVRDNILKYMNSININSTSKSDTIKTVNEHLNDFKQIALNTIKENGYNYDASVEINNIYFPTKKYGDITLPNGYYDALRIKIGNSEGQNWWCVMFPSLCFIDVTSGIIPEESKELIKENLSEEEYNLINSNSSDINIKFKFKIIEFINNFNNI